MSAKPHLSSSQLQMFARCPEQYRRRYIEGERVPPGIALLQGMAYHRAAEANFRQKIESRQDLPAAEVCEVAAAAFEAEQHTGYSLTDEEAEAGASQVLGQAKDQAIGLVDRIYCGFQAADYQPVAVEHTSRIVCRQASHDLLAVTDLRDDKGRVVEFKTANRRFPASEIWQSTQLTIYAAAYQIDVGSPPAEVRLDVAVKTKTPGRQVLIGDRTPADMQALVHRVNVTLAAIQAGNFPPCPPGVWWCGKKYCGYWASCPFVNSERAATEKGAQNGD